jgi:hypothetical protein
MNTVHIVAALDKEIARLNQVKALLAELSNGVRSAARNNWAMSTEGRKRVAAAQRKRWAKAKRIKKQIEGHNRYVDMRSLS